MNLAIVDTREWQNMFDLGTGARVEAEGSRVELMKSLLARHPYPGDMVERCKSCRLSAVCWVRGEPPTWSSC